MIAPAAGTVLMRTTAHALMDAPVFPHHPEAIPPGIQAAGDYDLRFAWTRADLHAVQALRYTVFHDELAEGGIADNPVGRDQDERDSWFHHLMIVHRASAEVVGTYRVQTAVMAATRCGFYSSTLFELGAMPSQILDGAVETGRACVAASHRSGLVLRLLWRGLARYLLWNSKRYIFGCCSLPGTDPAQALAAWRTLATRDVMHERVLVRPHPHARALVDDGRNRPNYDASSDTLTLPALMEGYFSLGAKICSAPAFDREFRTTDLLVLLDIDALDPPVFRSLFG